MDLLPDPAQAAPPSSEYVITAPLYKYPRDWILNHRVDSQGKLGLGDNISGMLIFRGVEPIPADLRHGSLVEVGLNVVLQGGQSFATTCLMTVDKGFEGRVIQLPGQIYSEAPPRSCEQSVSIACAGWWCSLKFHRGSAVTVTVENLRHEKARID